MWTLFTINLGLNKPEFEVRGVATLDQRKAKFQAICNGGVFFESLNYETVRQEVLDAVELNQVNEDELQ